MSETVSPQWGISCPNPNKLQTGDLLFPRKPQAGEPGSKKSLEEKGVPPSTFALEGFALDIKVRQFLEHSYPELPTTGTSQLLESWYAVRPPAWKHSHLETKASGAGQFDLNDPRLMYLVYKILKQDMSELFDEWLEMSVKEFVKSKLGKFLFKLLRAPNPTEGNLFIGHVALVIREHEGIVITDGQSTDGQVYVIEANTTDYSHYRVAMHPYWVNDAADKSEGELRGWANRRLAESQKVWSARPAALMTDGAAGLSAEAAVPLRGALATHAKRWHGRPYGLFDHPEFGEPDRMYCAEYLHRVFQDADSASGATQTDLAGGNRTWGWMEKYFEQTGDAELQGYLLELRTDKGFAATRPFFLLTPAMMWSSSVLGTKTTPDGCRPYAPKIPA